MGTKKIVHIIAFVLLVIGGLNWGLFGLFRLDLIEVVFGAWPVVADILYTLVGISAVYLFVTHAKDCKTCSMK